MLKRLGTVWFASTCDSTTIDAWQTLSSRVAPSFCNVSMPQLPHAIQMLEVGSGAREIVLNVVNKFRCQ